MDWLHPAKDNENSPVIVVLPGLTGSSSSSYIRGFVLAGQEAGFRIVVFNNRGIGIELKVNIPKRTSNRVKVNLFISDET